MFRKIAARLLFAPFKVHGSLGNLTHSPLSGGALSEAMGAVRCSGMVRGPRRAGPPSTATGDVGSTLTVQ